MAAMLRDSVAVAVSEKNTKKISLRRSRSPNYENVLFDVVVLQRTGKKYTKIYDARAQSLFFSLNLLFVGVVVAVARCGLLKVCVVDVHTGPRAIPLP